MPEWQNGGQAYNGNQVYYNPYRGNQVAPSYRSDSNSASTFQVKAGNIAVKYKGDANSPLAQTAAQIGLLAVINQKQKR
jgi:hypothetical protein